MKAAEQYSPVVQFVMLYKAVLTFESVDKILKSNRSNESYSGALLYGAVFFSGIYQRKLRIDVLTLKVKYREHTSGISTQAFTTTSLYFR